MIQRNFSATRIVAFVSGAWAGWLGLYHGYFEILQGNVKPDQASLINE